MIFWCLLIDKFKLKGCFGIFMAMLLGELPLNCLFCNSEAIYVVQYRNNLNIVKPIYRCRDCGRRFTPDDGFKKFRTSPVIIKAALNMLEQKFTLSQITYNLYQTFGVGVSRKSILDWKRKFGR